MVTFVAAYDILLREAFTRSLFFVCSYGTARCAKTVGAYLLGPVADIPVIQDYIATAAPEEILEKGSKLITGGVSILGAATSDFVYPEIASRAAGRVAGEMVNTCEKELKEAIGQVMSESNTTAAWMKKYILGDETLEKLHGGARDFEPNQNRYVIIKIIADGLIMVLTITLIKCKSKIGKLLKKINPKKLYVNFKAKSHKKYLKDKEKLELLYAI